MTPAWLADLAIVLRAYGLAVEPADLARCLEQHILIDRDALEAAGVVCHAQPALKVYTRRIRTWLGRRAVPAYQVLDDHFAMSGAALEPIWVDAQGHTCLAWLESSGERKLALGFDPVAQLIRYRQGDPARANQAVNKALYGFEFERPNYLFQEQLHDSLRTIPWADRLGFTLARMLAPIMSMPLIEPLPGGARGLVLLTGDDDQAFLDKYDQQLRAIGTTPITYYLVPQTRHTPQTLGALPSTVDFGVHPDALERPDLYDSACAEQTAFVRGLTGRACRTVRNHGYLNRGYLGHLQAWESNGLELDLNLPGVDGTALNGSFLPMRVRRPDGSWSSHFTLLTAFGDGMMLALNMSARAACRSITRLAQQVERDAPAVLVFNLHPQNISQTVALHKKVRWLCARPGWRAMSVERYLDWVKRLDQVCVQHHGGGWTIRSEEPVEGLVMSVPESGNWRRVALPRWSGEQEVV